MIYHPHNYQAYATQWIIDHPIGVLLLDMGLGKTIITLTAISELMFDWFTINRVLIIAPLRVAKYTWPNEIMKWEHTQCLMPYTGVAIGDANYRKRVCLDPANKITIINRENVAWLVENVPWIWDTVIIDELSSFKSTKATRFRALMKVRPKIKRILGLTGTPTSNGLLDLFAQFKLLDNGQRLGRYVTTYRQTYFVPGKRNRTTIFEWIPKPDAESKIYSKIQDITVSMKAVDYLDMPDLHQVPYPITLSNASYKQYRALLHDFILEHEGQVVDAVNAAVLTSKLMQLSNGVVYDESQHTIHFHDEKLDALEDVIESANGRNVLIAYWFKYDPPRILKRFPNAKLLQNTKDFDDWNKGKINIGLIHPAAAGHGLNLQSGGSILIWYSLTWSLELYQQTNARLYRQGQTSKSVTIIHLIVKDTIDEQVYKALAEKNVTQQSLIEAVKATIA